jgi:hypothetical protein
MRAAERLELVLEGHLTPCRIAAPDVVVAAVVAWKWRPGLWAIGVKGFSQGFRILRSAANVAGNAAAVATGRLYNHESTTARRHDGTTARKTRKAPKHGRNGLFG